MSRTKHHRHQNRRYGRDLWSRRPCSMMSYDPFWKRMTRRIERARKNKDIENETEWSEADDQ